MNSLSFHTQSSTRADFSSEADFDAEAIARADMAVDDSADQSSQSELASAAESDFDAEAEAYATADAGFGDDTAGHNSAGIDTVETTHVDGDVEGGFDAGADTGLDGGSGASGGFGEAAVANSGDLAVEGSAGADAHLFV